MCQEFSLRVSLATTSLLSQLRTARLTPYLRSLLIPFDADPTALRLGGRAAQLAEPHDLISGRTLIRIFASAATGSSEAAPLLIGPGARSAMGFRSPRLP